MRRLVALAVLGIIGAALVVPLAFAQTSQTTGKHGDKDYNKQFTKIGGGDQRAGANGLVYEARVHDDGSIAVKRSDLPEARDQRTTVISASVGANGGLVTSIVPVPIKGAKYVTLQLLMTPGSAAADTDSVNVEVFAYSKQTDQPTDGINLAFDMDQTDAFMTPLYFTRNQNPINVATGMTWGRRVFCGRQAGQLAAGSFNTAATAAIVDASGAPLVGEYLALRVVNRNANRALSIEISAYIHYE